MSKEKTFQEHDEYRLYRINHYGKKYGWTIYLETPELIVFTNKECMLTINVRNLTIETELNHPKKGETILLRKGNFTMKLIEKIFRNPRVHTPDNIKTNYVV